MPTREDILNREFPKLWDMMIIHNNDSEFVNKMKNAIKVSHYKYGWMCDTYPTLAKAFECLKERFDLYLKTHNTEWLVDVANFALIEERFPMYDKILFKVSTINDSPKEINGNSLELLKWMISKYEESHDTGIMLRIGQMCAFEYYKPTFEDAFYEASDSDKSPGLAGGISYNELMNK